MRLGTKDSPSSAVGVVRGRLDVAEVVALALAIAVSPFPVVPAVLLLFSARPGPTSWAFLVGWWVGVGVPAGLATVFAESVSGSSASPAWLSWARVVAGALLLVYGVRSWVARESSTEPPRWLRSIETATPRTAARLALVLSAANPKVVLVAVAAGLDIGSSGLTAAGDLLAVVGFTLLATIGVAVPVIGYAVLGERVLPLAARAKDWLLAHSAAILAVLVVIIGAVLIKNGVTGLL